MMQQIIAKNMGPVEWLLLIILSVLWGGSFFFTQVAVVELPPFTLVLGRVGLAALALNLLVRARRLRMPGNLRAWLPLFIMGGLNNLIPFCLIVWGQGSITSGMASLLNAATPLFALILAHFLTQDEKMSFLKAAGLVLGMAGVGIMVGLDALSGLGVKVWAQLAVLTAALSYAFAGIYGRRFSTSPALVIACGQTTASSIMLIPLVIYFDQPWRLAPPSLVTTASVLGSALLSTALAYIIYFRILQKAGASNLLLVTLMIPVSATILGCLVLGETMSHTQGLGMILISLALLLVDGRIFKMRRGNSPMRAAKE
jgi:drug/metabolite transporter (DMT)-like permease